MSLTHTVTGRTERRTYTGIRRFLYQAAIKPGHLVAVLWYDSDGELWLVDGKDGLATLHHYAATEYGHPCPITLLRQA